MDSYQEKTEEKGGKIPILGRDNWKRWFNLQRYKMESQSAFFAIDDLMEVSFDNIKGKTLKLQEEATTKEILNTPTWTRHNAVCNFSILSRITEEDEFELEGSCESGRAAEKWVYLWNKYSQVLPTHAHELTKQFVTFEMSEEFTIRSAWTHLVSLGKRIADVDPEGQHYRKADVRMTQLLSSLPPDYHVARDTIMAQPKMDHERTLKILEAQEARLDPSKAEYGMAATWVKPSGLARPLSCLLCEKDHLIKDCPSLPEARKVLRSHSQPPSSQNTTHVKKKRTPPPTSRRTPREKSSMEELKKMVKKLSSDMLSLQKNQAQSYTSKAKKTGKGFSAQESPCSSSPETMSDDDEYDEVAHSTAEVQDL